MINRMKNATLIRAVIILIGLLYGTWHHFGTIPKGFNEGFMVLLLLLLLEQVVELIGKIHQDVLPWDNVSYTDRYLLGRLFYRLQSELRNALRVNKDFFVVDHGILALYSYDAFWKLLVEQQEGQRKPMHIQVTHSCDFGIWVDHPLTQSLIDRQRLFHEKSGTISRVLCGRGPNPDPSIQKAALAMRAAGVEVFYYDLTSNLVDFNFGWDFLRVDGTGCAVIWTSFSSKPGGVITEAVYTKSGEYRGKRLTSLWDEIKEHAQDFQFEGPGGGASGDRGIPRSTSAEMEQC